MPQFGNKEGIISIDSDGDLTLVVGPDKVQMRVDANALRRASKFFNRLLFGPFKESHRTADWTVELPEDDPEALEVILHAAHANMGSIPLDLKLSELYRIIVMADKFKMMDLLRPWASTWTSTKKTLTDLWKWDHAKETSHDDLRRLCVLYHFGTPQQFEEILLALIFKSKTDPDGNLLFKRTIDTDGEDSENGTCQWGQFQPLPQTIIDFASQSRFKMIDFFLLDMNDVFEFYTSDYRIREFSSRCRSTALGVMIRCLVGESLWPIPSPEKTCLSMGEMGLISRNIQRQIKDEVGKHCQCSSNSRGSNLCQVELHHSMRHVEDLIDWRDLWRALGT